MGFAGSTEKSNRLLLTLWHTVSGTLENLKAIWSELVSVGDGGEDLERA